MEPVIVNNFKGLDWGQAEINSLKGTVAKVSIGQPYCINLFNRSQIHGEPIDSDILAQKEKFDFYFLSLCCSFQPINNCRFLWASFSVDLNAKDNTGKVVNENDKPIAWDIIPKKILSTTAFERQSKIDCKVCLDLKFVTLETDLSGKSDKSNYLIYEPKIYSSGLRTSKVVWNFKSSQEEGIFGDMSNLIIIVKATKGSLLMGRFSLGGEVEFASRKGLIRTIVETAKEPKAIDLEYVFPSW